MRINSFLIKLKLNKYGEINLFKIFLCLHFMKKIQHYNNLLKTHEWWRKVEMSVQFIQKLIKNFFCDLQYDLLETYSFINWFKSIYRKQSGFCNSRWQCLQWSGSNSASDWLEFRHSICSLGYTYIKFNNWEYFL